MGGTGVSTWGGEGSGISRLPHSCEGLPGPEPKDGGGQAEAQAVCPDRADTKSYLFSRKMSCGFPMRPLRQKVLETLPRRSPGTPDPPPGTVSPAPLPPGRGSRRKLAWGTRAFSAGHGAGRRVGPRAGSQAPHSKATSSQTGSKTGAPRPQPSTVGLRSKGRGTQGVQAGLGRNQVPLHKHRVDDWVLSVAPTAGSPQALQHPSPPREKGSTSSVCTRPGRHRVTPQPWLHPCCLWAWPLDSKQPPPQPTSGSEPLTCEGTGALGPRQRSGQERLVPGSSIPGGLGPPGSPQHAPPHLEPRQ